VEEFKQAHQMAEFILPGKGKSLSVAPSGAEQNSSQGNLSALSTKNYGQKYLSTKAMRATASSMSLVSSVLGFEIVEIWTEVDGNFFCTYVSLNRCFLVSCLLIY
jgi:hypothetical protein